MLQFRLYSRYLGLFASCMLLGACTTPSASVSTATTASGEARFSKLLVIGVAESLDSRAQFERSLASELRASGVDAKSMLVVAGGSRPIERQAIEDIVQSGGYDAVLISRPLASGTGMSKHSGAATTKTVRREGSALDLFRYDYEELNEPTTWNVDVSATLLTELYSASSSDKVWTAETRIESKETLEQLVSEASKAIVRQLQKDRLLGR